MIRQLNQEKKNANHIEKLNRLILVVEIMVGAHGVRVIEHFKNKKNNNLPKKGRLLIMSNDKELLEPKGITSAELKSLVDEFLTRGGKIKTHPEGVALNYRLSVLEEPEPKKFQVIKKTKKSKK